MKRLRKRALAEGWLPSVTEMKSSERRIKIGEATVEIDGNLLRVKGPKGVVEKRFKEKSIKILREGNDLVIMADDAKRKRKRVMCTVASVIRGMFKGATHGYEYRLKICSSHFPMNVSLSGKELTIKNFLGEKSPRILKIKDNVDIKLEKEFIVLTGIDKEKVGQAAADIEQKSSIRDKDRRVFMDGIYIVSKG